MSIKNVGNKCCGCRACLQKCPTKAIEFITDKYGFEYPDVNVSKCIGCNLCETVCPVLNEIQKSENCIDCGVAYAVDKQTKYGGSSGGLFGVFAKKIIDLGGVVFGAAFDENLKLITQKAETTDELYPIYKSKYLLCNTAFSFFAIEKELREGRVVLYCSTPCQITALKLYLNKEYSNLFTIDFVCHGVGSQTLFDKSISFMENKKAITIKNVVFRYKKSAASAHYYLYQYLKGGRSKEKSGLYFSFPYYYAYCKELAYRDSCYDCKYASRKRAGDITIGDFHSVHKYYPNIDRFAGVSMFLVNTKKGENFFNDVKDDLIIQKTDKEILYKNNRFTNQAVIPPQVFLFRESVANEPFDKTVKKFLNPYKEWKKLIYYKSPDCLRKFIMKFNERHI